MGPLGVLILGVVLILGLLLYFRLHPFLALLVSALACAAASGNIPWERVLPTVSGGFADLMGRIGILLVLASIVGRCLVDSGAADKIIRSFVRLFGEGREHYSFLASGFVLSMPVFFDMVFYLLAPLVRAAYARRRRDYALMICAAAAGGAITHALVPPTPGPILVSEALDVPIGLTVGMGTLLALVPAVIGGVFYANFINRRLNIVPREVYGESIEHLERQVRRPESELPSLAASLAPVVIPVGLIALSTAGPLLLGQDSPLARTLTLVGDKDLAFLLGAGLGIWLVASRPGVRLREVTSSLEPAVVSGTGIAFITCAGGSFGRVLTDSGVGGLIASAAQDWGLSLMLLSFLCAALIRVAQGSATVAMVTTAGIVAPTLAVADPGFHPVYLVAVIGYGATTTSWMNDSGFWIVCKMAGLSESETLKTWTVLLTVVALSGFLWVRLVSWVFPLT